MGMQPEACDVKFCGLKKGLQIEFVFTQKGGEDLFFQRSTAAFIPSFFLVSGVEANFYMEIDLGYCYVA